MSNIQAEAYNTETFECERCKREFKATVATWVDVSRYPVVKKQLQQRDFNRISCPFCGHSQFSGSFFFYEDFAEGLLVAVFPSIPVNHASLEDGIRRAYGYYPVLEIFYDMTQLWFLIHLQEYYRNDRNAFGYPQRIDNEARLQKFLQFVKNDSLMLTMRETLADLSVGKKTIDDLQDILWQAIAKLEGTPVGPAHAAVHAELPI
jgi:hypothetical protein